MRLLAVSAVLAAGPALARGACGFDSVDLKTSPGFKIAVSSDYKVLEDTGAGVKYGLYCGSQPPSGVDGVSQWFKAPVGSAGVRVPAASGFLEALGLRDKLAAAEAPANLTNICLDASKISTLGADGSSAGDPGVDVVFAASAGGDGGRAVRLPSDDSLAPLQKAEWIKFVAAFFNQEKAAAALFDGISSAYACHKGNLQHLKTPPHAYWVQYVAGSGGAKPTYSIVASAYQKTLLADAGAVGDTKTPPADPADVAAFHDAVKDADFVVDQTALTQMGSRASEWYRDFGYTDPQNSGVAFLRSRSIWRTDGYTSKSGVSNFPEFGYVRPDLALQDLISVLEPTYNATYHHRWMLWLGGTNEDTETVGPDNYNCASPWLASVAKCSPRTDFVGGDPAASNTPSDADKGSGGSGSSSSGRAGKIAAGILGAIAVVGLVVVGLHYYNRHRRDARIRVLSQSRHGAEGIGLRGPQGFV